MASAIGRTAGGFSAVASGKVFPVLSHAVPLLDTVAVASRIATAAVSIFWTASVLATAPKTTAGASVGKTAMTKDDATAAVCQNGTLMDTAVLTMPAAVPAMTDVMAAMANAMDISVQ